MLGRTHLLTGILLGLILIDLFSFSGVQAFLLLVFCMLGSLFPDIDEKHSLLGRHMKLIGIVFKHRGLFHNVLFLGLIATALWITLGNNAVVIGFFGGILSHLLLDGLTREGITLKPILKKLRGPVRVGGWMEYVFFVAVSLAVIALVVERTGLL